MKNWFAVEVLGLESPVERALISSLTRLSQCELWTWARFLKVVLNPIPSAMLLLDPSSSVLDGT
jgi:hypothetical protein